MTNSEPDGKMRILLAAKKLFARQGFDATSVRQICEEAGANVALVSYHFGGKENVFNALYDAFFPTSRISLYEDILKDPVRGVALVIREVISFRDLDPEMAAITVREIVTQSPRGEHLNEYTVPLWLRLRHMLEEGKQKGFFHYESVHLATMFVMGAVLFPAESAVTRELLSGTTIPTNVKVAEITRFVFNGLGAPHLIPVKIESD